MPVVYVSGAAGDASRPSVEITGDDAAARSRLLPVAKGEDPSGKPGDV